MAPSMAAVLRAPGILCSFSYVLFVFFLLFYVLDVVSITVYDRDTLLGKARQDYLYSTFHTQ